MLYFSIGLCLETRDISRFFWHFLRGKIIHVSFQIFMKPWDPMTLSADEEDIFECCKCQHSLHGHRYVKQEEGCFCVNCYNKFLAEVCFSCEQKIHPSYKSFTSEGKYWHDNCLVCTRCEKSLGSDKFGLNDKKTYCCSCYDSKFAPKCFKCNELISFGTPKLTWRKNDYHSTCLNCFSCQGTLSSEPFHPRNDAENYCLNCFKEQFAHKCGKCSEPITVDGVLHQNIPYHSQCFLCAQCKGFLKEKQFTLMEDGETCSDCYARMFADKCAKCEKPITSLDGDKHTEFEGRKWHESCMVCTLCGASLVEKYFLAEGQETGGLSIMCLDCGLKQKGLDPEKYRDGFYDEVEFSDEDENSRPDPELADDFKLDILHVHNNYRQKHEVPPLKWSNSCAKDAQIWAEKLANENKFEHSNNPRYGENIAKATKMNPTADEIVWHWYREVENYDFSKLEFQKGTGHWAQVVWRSTKYAGFGYAKRGDSTIIVGNYKCPGNMLGQFDRNITKPVSGAPSSSQTGWNVPPCFSNY